tara:strand:- start:28659 stop:28826 length:168 start_codon:yes stop_codon:yes gene_type:complete
MPIDEQTLQKIMVALAAAIDLNNDIDQSIVVKLWKTDGSHLSRGLVTRKNRVHGD